MRSELKESIDTKNDHSFLAEVPWEVTLCSTALRCSGYKRHVHVEPIVVGMPTFGRMIQGVEVKYGVCRLDPVCDRQGCLLRTYIHSTHSNKILTRTPAPNITARNFELLPADVITYK